MLIDKYIHGCTEAYEFDCTNCTHACGMARMHWTTPAPPFLGLVRVEPSSSPLSSPATLPAAL